MGTFQTGPRRKLTRESKTQASSASTPEGVGADDFFLVDMARARGFDRGRNAAGGDGSERGVSNDGDRKPDLLPFLAFAPGPKNR